MLLPPGPPPPHCRRLPLRADLACNWTHAPVLPYSVPLPSALLQAPTPCFALRVASRASRHAAEPQWARSISSTSCHAPSSASAGLPWSHIAVARRRSTRYFRSFVSTFCYPSFNISFSLFQHVESNVELVYEKCGTCVNKILNLRNQNVGTNIFLDKWAKLNFKDRFNVIYFPRDI